MKRPEMTDEQKEAHDCMHKAMESCGIQIPERPEHTQGERPDFPNGEMPPRPDMPEQK